ncbi:MAG: hypothetical protein MRY51_07635 [Flavobacteriaceae bacterium]|jgi:hypothetical protein|nr:hypothetical protein [Flavobacteriaceae bacterium]MCI5088161.1 hypothetical protein [Flavobacteriaceae bacterium]
MQVSQFNNLLENPSQIVTEKQTQELEEVLKNYPYFQAARGMHLLGLKNTNSYLYNAALKKHAAYTTDRSWLFEIITADAFNDTTEIVSPEQYLNENSEGTPPQASTQASALETETQTAELSLDMGKPLQFSKNDRHSFEQWLSITSSFSEATPKNKKQSSLSENKNAKETASETDEKAVKMAQIDAFLAQNPKINSQKEPQEEIDLKASIKLNKEALMTETLARVYLEQKKYKKALQAYKILSLKYPEKNSFFASQIKSVQKLIKDKQ